MLPPMSESLYLSAAGCLLAGLVLGAAATRWLALRREQALRIELAVLQSQVKTQEELERERAAALERATEGIKTAFGSIAGASLRSNSELCLKIAREHLGSHQQTAVAALTEREKAIEAMLAPIREALTKTEQQMARIEKERAETFGTLKTTI